MPPSLLVSWLTLPRRSRRIESVRSLHFALVCGRPRARLRPHSRPRPHPCARLPMHGTAMIIANLDLSLMRLGGGGGGGSALDVTEVIW